MKQDELKGTIGQSKTGSQKLVDKLQTIFSIYADDLQTFIDRGTEYKLLHDDKMFDTVVKLLNVLDKIKKVDAIEGGEEEKPKGETKVKNIQDLIIQ